MKYRRCYNGVRQLGNGPSIKNIQKLDSGCMPMVMQMAKTGLRVDLDHFHRLEKELSNDMESITAKVHDITGYWVNLDSGDQVADLLFKKLGLKQARPKMTPTGDRESVEDEVLKAIQHEHPAVGHVQDFKELSKLRGTYVEPMPKLAKRVGFGHWRMFPNFTATRVPAGRFACKEPNLLAIPTRTERGKDIRKGFITDEGWTYLSVDFSQLHPRLGAHYSGDPNLIRVYETGEDIYSDFAIAAFSLDDNRCYDACKWKYPSVHKMDHRYPSKVCVLASIYDVSPKGLVEQLPVICANCRLEATKHTCGNFTTLWTEQRAAALIMAFYSKYPQIMEDRKKHHAITMRNGMIWDMWGRFLHVQAVRSVHSWVVAAALREAANFPYLGGEVGCMKLAMAEFHDTWEINNLEEVCHPLLCVHDELLFETREEVAEEIADCAKDIMEHCVVLRVPIVAESAKANTWGDIPK